MEHFAKALGMFCIGLYTYILYSDPLVFVPLTVQIPKGKAKKTKNAVLLPGLEGQSCEPLDERFLE